MQAQSYCLKHMILSVPDLRKVYSEIKLSEVIVMMIDRLPEKQLDESKINTIKEIVHCPLFENSQCREILLPAMASHVRYVGFTFTYRISANSFRGNYSFLEVYVKCGNFHLHYGKFLLHKLNSCRGNY